MYKNMASLLHLMCLVTVFSFLFTALTFDIHFQAFDLSLTLISGLTGAKLGHPVPFNLTGQGKLIGPLLHETQQGAFYILFGLGEGET